jgi:subtilisin
MRVPPMLNHFRRRDRVVGNHGHREVEGHAPRVREGPALRLTGVWRHSHEGVATRRPLWVTYVRVTVVLCAGVVGIACSADTVPPVSPDGASVEVAESPDLPEAQDRVYEFLADRGILGSPVRYEGTTLDWPDEAPVSEASIEDLMAAIKERDGRVFVGFREVDTPRLAATVHGPPGARKAVVHPVSAETLEAGRDAITELGGRVIRPYRHLPFVVAVIDPASAEAIRAHPLVSWVEPVHSFVLGSAGMGGSASVPDNVFDIRAPMAWPVTEGEGTRVWFLDSGTAGGFSHHVDLPQLNPYTCLSMTPSYSTCEDVNDHPSYGHGTKVAGVAVAKGQSALFGAAPSVFIHGSVKLCGGQGCQDTGATVDAVASALELLRHNGMPDVVNMSVGWRDFSQGVAVAAAEAYAAGDLLVAMAGNLGMEGLPPGEVMYPGKYPSVIAVSGTGPGFLFWNGSANGPEVELSAPACVETLAPLSGTTTACGTSYSAPAVSGVAALVWSQNPGWTNVMVRDWLQEASLDLGEPGWNEWFGFGRIDACIAVGECDPPLPPFDVEIIGPSSVRPNTSCAWTSSTDGGSPPFEYEWLAGETVIGLEQTLLLSDTGGSDFLLAVSVTGADERQTFGFLDVTVDPMADPCPPPPGP